MRVLVWIFVFAAASAFAQETPKGEITGSAFVHTPDSLAASIDDANVVLPIAATSSTVFSGKFRDIPKSGLRPVPVVIFMHGSSGLGLAAIGEFQQFLGGLGYASVAPNSFTLAGRVTYKSPIDKENYERIHALRTSEIAPALNAVRAAPWADSSRLVLAGTSEGAVPVARYTGTEFAARMLFAWSCELNYFVSEPKNAFEMEKPVLNVISMVDPFFSSTNAWLGNPAAKGHCDAALKGNTRAAVALLPAAPHTLLNFPATRAIVAGFLPAAIAK